MVDYIQFIVDWIITDGKQDFFNKSISSMQDFDVHYEKMIICTFNFSKCIVLSHIQKLKKRVILYQISFLNSSICIISKSKYSAYFYPGVIQIFISTIGKVFFIVIIFLHEPSKYRKRPILNSYLFT